MKKTDFILIASVLFISAVVFFFYRGMDAGIYAVVSVDGREDIRLPLETNTTYTIHGEGGYNILVIEDGRAYLSEADCPDKRCVRMGAIRREGESVICLPHKVVVEITGGEKSESDVMVY